MSWHIHRFSQKRNRTYPVSKDYSLSFYLTLCLSITVVIISTLIIIIDYYYRYQEVDGLLTEKSNEYINLISSTLSIPIWNIDTKAVEHIGKSYSDYEFVSELIIKDRSDNILYQLIDHDRNDVFKRKKDISYQEYIIGSVEISFSLGYYKEKIQSALSTSLIITLVTLITLSLSTGVFLRGILKIHYRTYLSL